MGCVVVVLVAVVLALVLLYGWVCGRPFARFVVTLAIGGFGLLLLAAVDAPQGKLLGAAIAAVAWPIGSVPTWIRSRPFNQAVAKL